jgi:hypothetical protein
VSDGVITDGRAAWDRLKSREQATWQDWLAVGEALIVGRTRAMQTAKTNKPVGTTYVRAIGHWLRANGFDEISPQERYRAVLCVENRDAIEAWRATLDDAKRRTLNHPGACWHAWRRSMTAEAPPPRFHVVNGGKMHRQGKAISWPGDCIRRAALSMRESRSTDFFILAKVALEAAIRHEIDLLELLPAPPRAPVKPPSSSAAAEVVAHAQV